MNKINFFVIADNAEIKNGKLHIEGIFDSVRSFKFPANHKSFTVIINFEITPGSHSHSFKIKNDNQNVIESPNFNFEVPPTVLRHQFLHKLNDLLLPREGKYVVEAYLDGKLIGETYFMAQTTIQSSYA